MNSAQWCIRDAELSDVDAIRAIELGAAEAPHWPLSTYIQAVSPPRTDPAVIRRIFVAAAEKTLLGFSVGAILRSDPGQALPRAAAEGELESLAVVVGARRQGIGQALCLAVLGWCRHQGAAAVTLEVRSLSAAPVALYRRLGFTVVGQRPGYYSQPPDRALVMRLPLLGDVGDRRDRDRANFRSRAQGSGRRPAL